MIVCVKTVTLEDPEFAGTYVVEREAGGRLVLEPVLTSAEEIDRRHGLQPASVEELEAEHGALADPDDEG